MFGATRALRRSEADVVQAWTIPAALAAIRSGRPTVFVFQGVLNEGDLEGRPRVKEMLLKAARESRAVVTYSETAAREFSRITGTEATPIEPGIRLDRFTPSDEEPGHQIVFCAADPSEPRKRVDLLVESFNEVQRTHPKAELRLMDQSNPDEAALVERYRSAAVTVLPAFREAFGLVVVESLACGTPVIGMTDGGAVPGIIGDDLRIGAIAEPTPKALAAAIVGALDRPADPAACRKRAEVFGIDRCAERFEALYRESLTDAER